VFGVALRHKDSVGTGSVFLRVEKREFGEGFFRGIGTSVIYFVLFLVFVFFLLALVFWFIYSRDKLFLELRSQYKTGLEEEDSYLRKKERENARLLKTDQERELNRRLFEQVRREQRRLILGVHRGRVKKLKRLKKEKKRDKMKEQIGKWKKKGYDVRVLEKKGKVKLPTVKGIRKQVQEWKKKGYDVRVLERNI
jgi:hypothetical protein